MSKTVSRKTNRTIAGLLGAGAAILIAECFTFAWGWRACGSAGNGLTTVVLTSFVVASIGLGAIIPVIGFAVGYLYPMQRRRTLMTVFGGCILAMALAAIFGHHVDDCRIDL